MPTQSVPTRRSSDLTPLQPPSPRSPRKPKPRKNRPAPKNPRTRPPPTAPDDQTTGTEPPSRWHRPLHHTHISGLASPKDHQAALFCRNAFEIGRAHVCTPVTNDHLVCRLLPAKKNKTKQTHYD